MIKNIIHNRFIILVASIIIFVALHYYIKGEILPTTETKDIWFYSGLGAMLFSLLFIEPYFTSPKNALTNSLPLLLVFLAIKKDFINPLIWWVIFCFIVGIMFLSIGCMSLSEYGKNKSEEHKINKISDFIKNIVILLGQGKILYSSVFIATLLLYYGGSNQEDNLYALIMFILWFFVILINPKNLRNAFSFKQKIKNINAIGEIFAVHSSKVYLVKIFEDKKNIAQFSTIKFTNYQGKLLQGFIFDIYQLSNQQWAKICIVDNLSQDEKEIQPNVVYQISDSNLEDKINTFVGIVSENSNISKINFEYSKKERDLEEGDLLKIEIGEKIIFYQVVNGITQSEILESKNQNGFIKGEAVQLGEWDNDSLSFKKFGWVADIYSPIFKVEKINCNENFAYPQYRLGYIPKTNIPSVINLNEAISHHIALIGVTGSGKSFLAREIIKQLMQDTKIICIDFTGEYTIYFQDCYSLYKNGLDKDSIETFMKSNENIGIFELPSISNTKDVLEQTHLFVESIFEFAKKQETKKQICLVLEEAHTIVPETFFLGDFGDYGSSKALVNKMGQVALQGRKYGVGLMVIGQRTANISKTILTQCNTMICFQAFDETNFNFLGNYIGKDLASTLPFLKQHHAIVAGKALQSILPLIVDVTHTQDEHKNNAK